MLDRNEILSKLKYFIDPNKINTQYKIWKINHDILQQLSANGIFPLTHTLCIDNNSTIDIKPSRVYIYLLNLLNKSNIDIMDVFYGILLMYNNKKITISVYDNIYVYIYINKKEILIYNVSDPNDGFLIVTRRTSDYTIQRTQCPLIKCKLKKLHEENLLPSNSLYISKFNFPDIYNIYKNTDYSMFLSFMYYISKVPLMQAYRNTFFDGFYDCCSPFLKDIYNIYSLIKSNYSILDITLSEWSTTNIQETNLDYLYKDKEDMIQLLNVDNGLRCDASNLYLQHNRRLT